MGSRRNTELFLLVAAAFPVTLLCALGVLSGLLIGALAHQVLNRLQRERE